MSRRTEEGKKEEEKAFKCYFRNSFCPFMSVLIFVCFENIGYQTDKNGHKTFYGFFCFFWKHDPPPWPILYFFILI